MEALSLLKEANEKRALFSENDFLRVEALFAQIVSIVEGYSGPGEGDENLIMLEQQIRDDAFEMSTISTANLLKGYSGEEAAGGGGAGRRLRGGKTMRERSPRKKSPRPKKRRSPKKRSPKA